MFPGPIPEGQPSQEPTGEMANPEEAKCRPRDTPISTYRRGMLQATESEEKPGRGSLSHFKPQQGPGLTQWIECP